jgi:hypothetical protein
VGETQDVAATKAKRTGEIFEVIAVMVQR